MQDRLHRLLDMVLAKQATDIHFTVYGSVLQVKVRGMMGMEEIHSAALDVGLFHYLKYIADLDLGNSDKPQSGSFQLKHGGKQLYFRFSLLTSHGMQSGVLRILNHHCRIALAQLSQDPKQQECFYAWTKMRSGMVILSGPTGSGKTTTLYALLDAIAQDSQAKIMSLEDPIEIQDDRFVQVAINEANGFTYAEGIRQFMRHDPDVIMIGEIRDSQTANMAYRCALTGHMVFSSIHAKTAVEALKRLEELGLSRAELSHTLSAICAQRLYALKGKERERVCIYEILEGAQLTQALARQPLVNYEDIYCKIKKAVANQLIQAEAAASDLLAETL